MRKIITALSLLLMMTGVCFAAMSDDVYLRKDVFDAKMEALFDRLHVEIGELRGDMKALSERIDGNFATLLGRIDGNSATLLGRIDGNFATLSGRIDGNFTTLSERIDGNSATLSGRIDGNFATLSGRMDGLDKRMDDLRNGIYLWLVAITLIVSWPKARDVLKNWIKPVPSITIEDVMRLIEENNAKLLRQLQRQ